ncbi:MAG TPA: hypothetical protein VMY88_10145 [Acidimicrobiales bacterium]|nr:hypothetical protein [Acidimicrobiales bacterium]
MNKEDVRAKLEALAEEIADLALDALRERDPDSERKLTRARRAVEKAAHLLDDRDQADSFADD